MNLEKTKTTAITIAEQS